MSPPHRHAWSGAATAAALTVIALLLLDTMVQHQLGTSLATVGLATRAGPGVIGLGALELDAAARAGVELAHARADLTWRVGGALVVALGVAGVLLNGVAARMAAWIEVRVDSLRGHPAAAR